MDEREKNKMKSIVEEEEKEIGEMNFAARRKIQKELSDDEDDEDQVVVCPKFPKLTTKLN